METEKKTLAKNKIHKLVKEIWTWDKRGYCWIDAKFGSLVWEVMPENTMKDIVECLKSKKEIRNCPVHNRIHGRSKGMV